MALLLTGCKSEFNSVYKYGDNEAKYEFAKECFANGKFQQAISLLEELVTIKKGSDEAQECLYMLAMAQYNNQDYEAASETFKKYGSSYPRGNFAEQAAFYVGEAYYESSPEPRLDQSPTNGAITAYQQFMDLYPDSKLRARAQDRLYELYDKLIRKEYLAAELYYNLGGYFGNINSNDESNYTSCIITAQNCLKDYPYCSLREDFMVLIMKSKFHLAENSSEEKRVERYRDAEDECYGFINEFPESKNAATAQKYIAKCKKVIKE
jgi:outer membrane protein assembly factor BamD